MATNQESMQNQQEHGIEGLKKAVEELARISRQFARIADDGTVSGTELIQVLGSLVVTVVPKYQQFEDIPKELGDLSAAEVAMLAQHITDQDWWDEGYDRAEQVAEAIVEWLATTYKVAAIILKKE